MTWAPPPSPPAQAPAARVLLVEDNVDLAVAVAHSLRMAAYEVEVAHGGDDALHRAAGRDARPDLVILDLMLPDRDGFEVLRTLRARGATMPVLILTARSQEVDKVMGLRLGADDYLTKPFGVLELLARVEALLRRTRGPAHARADAPADAAPDGGWETYGDLRLHRASRTLLKRGQHVELSPKEFDLLVALVDRRGRNVARLELLRLVWAYDASVVSRTVDTHVATLRRKLEDDPRAPRYVATSIKSGYRFIA